MHINIILTVKLYKWKMRTLSIICKQQECY